MLPKKRLNLETTVCLQDVDFTVNYEFYPSSKATPVEPQEDSYIEINSICIDQYEVSSIISDKLVARIKEELFVQLEIDDAF